MPFSLRMLLTRHATLSIVVFLCLLISLLFPSALFCQVAVGTPPYGSYAGGPDTINLGNLNSHVSAFTIGRPGRGTNFTYELTYDTSMWAPVTSGSTTTWQPVANYGWRGQTEVATGYVSYNVTQTPTCYFGGVYNGILYNYSNWTYHDPFGTPHYFPTGTNVVQPTGPYCSSSFSSATATASDGSGWTLSATGSSLNSITSSAGQIIHPPLNITSGAATYTDRNGNQITVNGSSQFFDTLSSTTPVLTISGSGTPASPLKFNYTAPSGSTVWYQLNYTNYTVASNFGVSGISEFRSAAAVPLVTSITLPDNSTYSFTYEVTPGTCTPYSGTTCTTARLTSVTLPTGGLISYSYSGGQNGINSDGTTATLTRTTPDGIWTYARTQVSGNHWQTVITDPTAAQNQTLVDFQKDNSGAGNYYETQRRNYSGSAASGTLLQTINTCYNGAASPCTGTAVALPITQRAVVSNAPGSTLQSKRVDIWNSYGMPTEIDEYDFGSGAPPATPIRKTLITYAALSNNINAFSQTVTVCSLSGTASACGGTGTVIAQTTNSYDQTTATATSGTPQHTSVSGSRGNLTTVTYMASGANTLSKTFTYYDTGTLKTSIDVNNATTIYNYPDATSTCGNAFPTSVSEPLSLSRSMTWNCSGGVQLTTVDENGKTTTMAYNDPYFWRPASVTDPLTNVTTFGYSIGNPNGFVQSLVFNGSQSIANTGIGLDSLGRPIQESHIQAPGASSWDQATRSYDSKGRPWKTSTPCVTTGPWTCPTTATTITYDPLNRPLTVTDGGGGTVTYSYTGNDVLVTIGPAPSGENPKRRQLEYDGLGRLTSVCELTTATGSGTCAQTTSQTGFWTKYTYDLLGNVTGVTQNAQAGSGQQTRSFNYDWLSRLTSETNAESGTTTYVYDSYAPGTCGGWTSQPGDLMLITRQNGTSTCYVHDALHRVTDVGFSGGSGNNCKRFRYDNSLGVLGARPSGVTVANGLGRLVEAETDTCATWPIQQSSIITDEWFSYTARGEISDFYESTLHSGGYYHSTSTYWANGVPSLLTAPGGYSVQYNLDGEGRIYSTAPSVGALNSTTYNAASQPTQVTFASSDSDTFTYDPNTGRMTQYKFTIGATPQSLIGNLTWNANGTLASQNITDPFNSTDTQNCSYTHDDLSRIASVNCGAALSQTFGYDAFGNLTKAGNYSFSPTYNAATNRYASIPGVTVSYDAAGNLLSDGSHTYSWDAYGKPVTIDGIGLTYDAFGRMVEQNRSGSYSEINYGPTGDKIQLMNGQSYTKEFVPLPGGAVAVYGGPSVYFYHPDFLGSAKLSSSSSRTYSWSLAYAPFGEKYASSGTPDPAFTGQRQDTVATGLYDFPAREYSIQGRWPSPDPAGLAAVNPANPQSWNRYAYALNNPLAMVDPTGLDPCEGANWFPFSQAANGTGIFTPDMCAANGGTWASGCFLDGAEIPCNLLMSVASSGGAPAAQCPNNDCSGLKLVSLGGHGDRFVTDPYSGIAAGCSGSTCLLQYLSIPVDDTIALDFLHANAQCPDCGHYFTNAYNGVKTATALQAGLTGSAFAAPAALSAATTAAGWGYGVAGTGLVALGSQADTEFAAATDGVWGVSRLSVSPGFYNFLNSMGQWWTFNRAFLDATTATGGRFVYVTNPSLVWSGSWYLTELQYLAGR
jgi:RHS repeat-associated protein